MEAIFTLIGVLVVVAVLVFGAMMIFCWLLGKAPSSSFPKSTNSSSIDVESRKEANRQARYQAEMTAKAMKNPSGRLTPGDVIDTHLRHSK